MDKISNITDTIRCPLPRKYKYKTILALIFQHLRPLSSPPFGRWCYRRSKVLNPDEGLLISSLVYRKHGLTPKKSQLLLTDAPRLLFVDPLTSRVQTEVKLNAKTRVEAVNLTRFTVCTVRVFFLPLFCFCFVFFLFLLFFCLSFYFSDFLLTFSLPLTLFLSQPLSLYNG